MLRVTKSSIQKLLFLCEILKLRKKKYFNIHELIFVIFLYCTKRRYSQIEPQLKVKIEEGRNSLEKIKISSKFSKGVGYPPINKGGD